MILNLKAPFTYKHAGQVKSLLGSIITGRGIAISMPGNPGTLIVASANGSLSVTGESEPSAWDDYRAHYLTAYGDEAVNRHVATVKAGGRAVYLEQKGGDLTITNDDDMPTPLSIHTMVPAACTAFVNKAQEDFATNATPESTFGLLSQSLVNAGLIAGGMTPVAIDTSGAAAQECNPMTVMFRWMSGSGYATPTYGWSAANTALYYMDRELAPGWCLIKVRVVTNSVSGGVTRFAIQYYRARCAPGSRAAFLDVVIQGESQMISGALGNLWRITMVPFVWVLRGATTALTEAWVCPATNGGTTSYMRTTHTTNLTRNGFEFAQVGVVVSGPAPGVVNPLDNSTIGSYDYRFKATWALTAFAGANSSGGMSTWETARDRGLTLDGYDPEWEEWSEMPATRQITSQLSVRTGRTLYEVGRDLTSNRLATFEYRVTSLPPMEDLTPTMATHPVLDRVRARITSAKLGTGLRSLESMTGEDLSDMITRIEVTPRVFHSYVGLESFRTPMNPLYDTAIYKMADEEGEDVGPEVFVEADPDDVESREMTFDQANALCRTWYLDGTRRGIVVPGGVNAIAMQVKAAYCAVVEGELAWVVSTTNLTPLDVDLRTNVYAWLVAGGRIIMHSSAIAHPVITGYVPASASPYDPAWDAICLHFYGVRYGQITQKTGDKAAAAETEVWELKGQMDGRFVKAPANWTNEFWLAIGSQASFRAEELVGTLLTNPFSIGMFTKETITINTMKYR